MIKIGANVHGKLEKNDVPILFAVKNGNLKCLKILIENGAKLNGPHQENIWYSACQGENAEIIKFLIESGYDINQRLKDYKNMTGLISSVYNDKLDSVKILIELGADLRAFDDYGRDAFHTAFYIQSIEIVEYFLNIGTDLKTCDKKGNNLIHQSLIGLNDSCSNRWADCPDGAIEISRKKTTEIILKLIDKVDLNVKNFKGDQPIHLLCEYRHMELLELFIKNGVKINSTDFNGRNVAHLTCLYRKNTEFLKKLIELGVDLDALDNENKRPFDYFKDYENLNKLIIE